MSDDLLSLTYSALQAIKSKAPFDKEANFQYTLGHQIAKLDPDVEVEFEITRYSNINRMSLDLQLTKGDQTLMIELKYKVTSLSYQRKGETYNLARQGAKDHGSYDILKDLQRLEYFTLCKPKTQGLLILLCNDPAYWLSTESDYVNQIDREFWLSPGREITGSLAWASHAGLGSIKGREAPIMLKQTYLIDWWDYVEVEGQGNTLFKALTIPVIPKDIIEEIPTSTPMEKPNSMASVKPVLPKCSTASQNVAAPMITLTSTAKEKKEPNWKRLNDIVVELGGRASLSQIRTIFDQRFQDQAKSKTVNVGPDLAAISVNHNSWHHYTKSGMTRLSDPAHPKDRLFYHEKTKEYETYCPSKHGLYEMTPGVGTKLVKKS